jgi:hypothetical protein
MRPVILGWIEQKYGYVPGASKRREKLFAVSSTGDLNLLLGTDDVVRHIVAIRPGDGRIQPATDGVIGVKLKLSITTS